MHIVTCLLKAGIAEAKETPEAKKWYVNTSLRQRIQECNYGGSVTRKLTLTLIFKRDDDVVL
jgi:hypothetical protein